MSIDLVNDSPLLSFFSAYQSAYQQARGIVSLATLGLPTFLQPADEPDTASKQFIISYQPPQTASSILNVGVLPQQAGIPTSPTALVFDVTLASSPNAIPQRVAYTAVARQTIEQSAVGFHVNEFGLGPGRLDMDAVIVYQGLQYAQVDSFFSFLRQIKTNNPISQLNPPGQVLFIDVYLQRQLSITVESVMIEEVAGTNNQAHLVMSSSVLKDYSAPGATNVTQSGLPASAGNLSSAAGVLDGVLEFLGVSLP